VKILGIDYGTVRIGLAISDETHTLARELTILSPKQFWQNIEDLVEQEGIEAIAVGLPLSMSGGQTEKSREVQEFVDQLQERITVPIELIDERLTSVIAESSPGGKTNTDSLAAQLILQTYLDKNKN
jgi:putative holliday junction resolvase